MNTRTIPALHPYQGTTLVRLLRALQSGARDVLLHAPCGSGKTLIIQALIALLQREVSATDHLRTFIVTAPFDQIVDSWTSGVEPDPLDRERGQVAVKLITFRKEGGPLKYKAEHIERNRGKDSRVFWEGFWRNRNSKSAPVVIVANRAALLTKHCMEALCAVVGENALRSFLFVADEAHHHASMREGRESSGNKSGELVDLLLARGATVLGSSATPYNTNGDVIRAGTVVVPLTYSEYQRQIDPRTITAECPEGKPVAPRRWELRSVETTYQTDDETIAVSKDVRVGNKETDAGASQGRLDFALSCVPAFVRQWTENKCVYTAMRFGSVAACMAGERALLTDKKVRRILGRAPRILNLGGTMTPEQKAEMFAALKHEAEIESYEDRRYDVVIGVNRLDEGTDVKLACDIFVTGLPRSASFFMQLLQRAGRGKAHIKGYPEDRQDTLRGYIFKPELTEESNERYAKDYSMSAGVLALFVASNDCVSLLNLGNTPRARSFGKRKGHTFADLTDKEQEDSVLEAEFQAAWHGDALQNSSEFFKIVRKVAARKDISMGELGAMVREAASEAPAGQRDALIRGAMAHVCNGDPKFKAAWEATERRVFKKAASKGYTAMRLIQADLAPEFFRFIKAHAGDIVPPLDRVLRDVVVIMGTTSEALAKSWSEQKAQALTLDQVALTAMLWREVTGTPGTDAQGFPKLLAHHGLTVDTLPAWWKRRYGAHERRLEAAGLKRVDVMNSAVSEGLDYKSAIDTLLQGAV